MRHNNWWERQKGQGAASAEKDKQKVRVKNEEGGSKEQIQTEEY